MPPRFRAERRTISRAGQRLKPRQRRPSLAVDRDATLLGRLDDRAFYHGQTVIDNRIASEFGNGWGFRAGSRLVAQEQGATIVAGDGDPLVYWKDGQGGWRADTRDLPTLTGSDASGYTFRDKHGEQWQYSPAGMLTSHRDRVGGVTTFNYTDVNGDGRAQELSQVVDAVGRTTTLAYGTDGLLDSIADFASHGHVLQHGLRCDG